MAGLYRAAPAVLLRGGRAERAGWGAHLSAGTAPSLCLSCGVPPRHWGPQQGRGVPPIAAGAVSPWPSGNQCLQPSPPTSCREQGQPGPLHHPSAPRPSLWSQEYPPSGPQGREVVSDAMCLWHRSRRSPGVAHGDRVRAQGPVRQGAGPRGPPAHALWAETGCSPHAAVPYLRLW